MFPQKRFLSTYFFPNIIKIEKKGSLSSYTNTIPIFKFARFKEQLRIRKTFKIFGSNSMPCFRNSIPRYKNNTAQLHCFFYLLCPPRKYKKCILVYQFSYIFSPLSTTSDWLKDILFQKLLKLKWFSAIDEMKLSNF